ncbi:hypothetical protein HPP92_013308 [Vanilla planifolia]|uniref:DNA (cytosine-5-)-methyltransferase n=1 Tax=Vanilla planifolia TaxID=51239 RepID=A0A835UWC4_VANPL|nr:hypothetical protein HPP92_013308 [Vanilla planifolia]
MAKSAEQCRTRQRHNVVDEMSAIEISSPASAAKSRRKRPIQPEETNGAPEERLGSAASEGKARSSSRKKIKVYDASGSEIPGEEERVSVSEKRIEEKQKDACEDVRSSKKNSEPHMRLGLPEEQLVNVPSDGKMHSSTRKKTKAFIPRGANLVGEEVEAATLEKERKAEKEQDVCGEAVKISSSKKKGYSGKKTAKTMIEEEQFCRFVGVPVPLEEAQRKWPHRYMKKVGGKRSVSSVASTNNGSDDELAKAKCHYYKAMVDGVIYNLNDHAHVKAGEGEPNYIGRIIEFFETIDGKLYFTSQWFYKAEDTVISYHAKDHDARRIFLSEDRNDNDLDCIVEKIDIVQFSNNINLKEKLIPKCDYYYDMSYSTAYSTFANLLKDENSGESSLSTISSEDRPEAEESSFNATLLDLYSGCGAMSTGLCQGACIAGLNLQTTWAVDYNTFACQSLQLNHPKAKVRNEKAEDFLALLKEWKKLCEKFNLDVEHPPTPNETEDVSYEQNNGDSSPIPKGEFEVDHFVDICYGDPNEIGKKELMFKVRWKGYGSGEDTWEPINGLSKCHERIETFVKKGYKKQILPLPGVVDVICGGPPCQGISGFNRFRDSNNPLADVRNQQMEVFMDIVEFLKPKFVLMENVVDILKFAEGFLGRFALSRLVRMNYQSRLGIMAAGCYGLPQFRLRVFLWGALSSEVLPQFPLPTHNVLVRGGAPVKFEENVVAYNENQCLQLDKALLLGDAISDLPMVENDEKRDELPYGKPPKTYFQYSIRLSAQDLMDPSCDPKKAKLHNTLFDHRPLQLNEDDYLRVCRVPVKKGANFRDFPGVRVGPNNVVEFDPDVERVLLPSGNPLVPDYAMSFIKGKSPKPFGRLWWDETVPTVVTRAEPHNQIILHPEQNRVLTVRENARLQGFPDYYKLCGPIKERYIQVGNAVALPVSRALGFALGRAFQAKVGADPLFTLPTNFPHFGNAAGEATN